MEEQLVVRLHVVEGDVTVRIDETRHDRGTGRVDDLGSVGDALIDRTGRTDRDDRITVDDDIGVRHRGRTVAIDQRAVSDVQCL